MRRPAPFPVLPRPSPLGASAPPCGSLHRAAVLASVADASNCSRSSATRRSPRASSTASSTVVRCRSSSTSTPCRRRSRSDNTGPRKRRRPGPPRALPSRAIVRSRTGTRGRELMLVCDKSDHGPGSAGVRPRGRAAALLKIDACGRRRRIGGTSRTLFGRHTGGRARQRRRSVAPRGARGG